MQKQLIARGSTGDIYRFSDGSTIHVLKVLDSRRAGRMISSVDTLFLREVKALRSATHRNIVSLISSEQVSPSEYAITLTYCPGGSLFSLLHKSPGVELTHKQRRKILSDVTQALICLHCRPDPIIHSDVKSLNLLLMTPVSSSEVIPWVKLCDFGSSKFESDPPVSGTFTVGTVQWMPPEILMNLNFGTPADVYSFAMVIFEVCFREVPFSQFEENVVSAKIIQGVRPHVRKDDLEANRISGLAQVMQSCWAEQPCDRPDISQVSSSLDDVFISSILTPTLRN